jgi:hypothetical protein
MAMQAEAVAEPVNSLFPNSSLLQSHYYDLLISSSFPGRTELIYITSF